MKTSAPYNKTGRPFRADPFCPWHHGTARLSPDLAHWGWGCIAGQLRRIGIFPIYRISLFFNSLQISHFAGCKAVLREQDRFACTAFLLRLFDDLVVLFVRGNMCLDMALNQVPKHYRPPESPPSVARQWRRPTGPARRLNIRTAARVIIMVLFFITTSVYINEYFYFVTDCS